ncbi:MAG: helix-turn-helix domain-containing protein [Nitrospira sp. BO4]|jgi:transcriptional regulator with XRE-family HTH domain|nr:helix-turn-helix domain-containing protein [Nitrospira sp. BO4]
MPKSAFTKAYESFRNILIEARKSAGLSQTELSSRLSRPQSFVSKYERGERRLDVIEFLEVAKAIGKDPQMLLRQISKRSSQ